MSNGVITESTLVTEADAEQKVIYPLLSSGNYLAIDEHDIRTKEYLAPTEIDKQAGKSRGYYPDYSI